MTGRFDLAQKVFVEGVEIDFVTCGGVEIWRSGDVGPGVGYGFLAAFDGRNVDQRSISEQTVEIAYNNQATWRRHIGFGINDAAGRSPAIRVLRSPSWQNAGNAALWQLCYGYDEHGEEWFEFPIMDIATGAVTGSGVTFTGQRVYFHTGPWYSWQRLQAKIDDWVANPLTSPTPSAVTGYEIGAYSARPGEFGTALPSMTQRAFQIGTGALKLNVSSGVHPDEFPGHWAFEAAIDFLLSSDADAAHLRAECTFMVYPGINSQCMYGGYTRYDPQSQIDANRLFGTSTLSQLRSLYQFAWTTDLQGLVGIVDFHGGPLTDAGRRVWTRGGAQFTAREAYLDALSAIGPVQKDPDVTPAESQTGWLSGQFSSVKLAVIHEYGYSRDHGVPEYRAFGVDMFRALADIVPAAFHEN